MSPPECPRTSHAHDGNLLCVRDSGSLGILCLIPVLQRLRRRNKSQIIAPSHPGQAVQSFGWRKRMRYESKRASFIVLYWPYTTTSPFFSMVSSAIKWMVIPTSKNRGTLKPTEILHARQLQWFKIDGAGLIKCYNLPLWTLPHKIIIVLKSNRLSLLSPTAQVRDPGLYQSENWTVHLYSQLLTFEATKMLSSLHFHLFL